MQKWGWAMKSFDRLIEVAFLCTVLCFAGCNLYLSALFSRDGSREYRVEADRAAVLEAIAQGAGLEEAAAPYVTDSAFDAWYEDFCAALHAAADQ